MVRAFIAALRPLHWAKNALVFVPALTAHRLDGAALMPALGTFGALSLAASSVYLVNDLADREADRAHPRKRARPVASGAVPAGMAAAAAVGLALAGVLLGWLAGAGLAVAGYLAAALVYAFWLKRVAWLDILILAGLHLGRVLAGGLAAGIAVSGWLTGFAFCVFLALAAMKRQAELIDHAGRLPGRGYDAADLPLVAGLVLAAAVAAVGVLAFYVPSGQVQDLYARPRWMWLICPVAGLWLGYLAVVARRGRMGDDPLVFALTNPVSLTSGAALIGVMALAA